MPAPVQKQLAELLLGLFSSYEELRSFLIGLPEGDAIVKAIPGKNAPETEHAYGAASQLEARGLVKPDLFRALLEERPGRADEIIRVAEAHLLDVSADARASAWVVHALRREAMLLGKIAKMESDLAGLKERLMQAELRAELEVKRAKAARGASPDLENLSRELMAITVDASALYHPDHFPLEMRDHFRAVPLQGALMLFADQLATGVTTWGDTPIEKFVIYTLVPKLMTRGVVQEAKVPAKAAYRRYELTKLGRELVAWAEADEASKKT